jgi:hypothetical protein
MSAASLSYIEEGTNKGLFPGITSVKVGDLEDGHAQFMAGVQDSTFYFVHSSHCLEHLRDAEEGLRTGSVS